MPGRKHTVELTRLVQLRVAPAEWERWREHVERHGGYLSVLIRDAVREHLDRVKPRVRCPHPD